METFNNANIIKTPTNSGGDMDAALKLKKDLKGETTIISPDNYTIDIPNPQSLYINNFIIINILNKIKFIKLIFLNIFY